MKNLNEILNEVENIDTKQLDNGIDLKDFNGKNIITYGTYDLFHVGHQKIIDHAIKISGSESNIVIAVSSDRWNSLKGKKSIQTQEERVNSIKLKYPEAKVILEDHDKPEETWPKHWDEYNLSLIVMGGDHFENLEYINNTLSLNGEKMQIAFYERTPKISSTLLREMKNY